MPVKREIVYPFFMECSQYTTDFFWENIFEDLAYGKAPHGTYLSKDYLCCSYKNKEFNYKIERKNPKILYEEIYVLLTEKVGIFSNKEKTQRKKEFDDIEKSLKNSNNEWCSIRKKNIKDTMYEKYVIEMKKKHNLSIAQTKYLLSLIFIGIMFKSISSKDINYMNNKITSIEGIEFSNGNFTFKKNLCVNCNTDNDYENENNSNCIMDNWQKFLKTYKLPKNISNK